MIIKLYVCFRDSERQQHAPAFATFWQAYVYGKINIKNEPFNIQEHIFEGSFFYGIPILVKFFFFGFFNWLVK